MGEEAVGEEYVDLWVASPECTPYSQRNHGRSDEEQDAEMKGIMCGLAYVARARPKVVIVENVTDRSIVAPLSGVLARLARLMADICYS